jgi:glycosyltransferase involved in cell wall biosynthesis
MSDVSVIIPTYQHADTLEACLKSADSQTLKPKEIIVVDDGSTDETSEILMRMSSAIPTLKIFRQENRGSNFARNRGFEMSSGKYVIFLDADAIMRADMLEKLYRALESNADSSFAYSSFKFGWKKFRSFPYDISRLKRMNYIHTSALIRRAVFPGFDEKIKRFQDWDLWLTIMERGGNGIFVGEELFSVVQTRGRVGISSWRPSLFYKIPWFGRKPESVRKYEQAREIILKKHEPLWI